RVGGPEPGAGNLISGNSGEGVWVLAAGTTGTILQGNLIGVAVDGLAPLPNQGAGGLVADGAHNNLIGGRAPGAANLISRNQGPGVRVSAPATLGHSIRANRI